MKIVSRSFRPRLETLEYRRLLAADLGCPVIEDPGPRTAIIGGTAEITFAFSDSTEGDTHAAAVDWGDGSPLTQLDSVTSPFTASHVYTNDGEYAPKVWVTDAGELSDSIEFSMTIYEGASGSSGTTPVVTEAPVITNPGPRTAIGGGNAQIEFEFTDITPNDTWAAAVDWGDGTPLTQLDSVGSPFTASHVYMEAGNYTPRVWVTDASVLSDSEEFSMTIYGNAPGFIPEAPLIINPGHRTATVGREITVTTGFTDANPGDTHSAAIDWGDGTMLTLVDSVTSPFTLAHTYTSPGNYTPTVWVTDQGLLSSPETFSMTVGEVTLPPVIETVATEQLELSTGVGVTFSDFNLSDSHTAAVDWGDGSLIEFVSVTGNLVSANHVYDAAGDYPVRLWVTDQGLLSDSVSLTLSPTAPPTPALPTVAFADSGDWWNEDDE